MNELYNATVAIGEILIEAEKAVCMNGMISNDFFVMADAPMDFSFRYNEIQLALAIASDYVFSVKKQLSALEESLNKVLEQQRNSENTNKQAEAQAQVERKSMHPSRHESERSEIS